MSPYHVGLYALVQHQGTFLIIRPAKSTLPPGRYGLPGAVLMNDLGSGVAELHLRRTLLSQLGLSVGELTLVGSHTLRTSDGGVLLNLIFGAGYNSGIPSPQPGVVLKVEWLNAADLNQRTDVPEWLMACVHTCQLQMQASVPGKEGRGGLNLRRGR